MNTILYKNSQEIKIMQDGGEKLAFIRKHLEHYTHAGMSLQDIEDRAQTMIKAAGGEAAFARVPGYNWATCLNVNDSFVHGIPNKYILKEGDVLTIDIGIYYRGFNTDSSTTFIVGGEKTASPEINKFLAVGKQTLNKAIKTVKPGRRVGHISRVIQAEIEKAGYNVSRNLTGHGIGRDLHEAPKIPCFLSEALEKTTQLELGMCLAIEILYLEGRADTIYGDDGWTIKSKDGKMTGVFEKTIAISADGSIVLT